MSSMVNKSTVILLLASALAVLAGCGDSASSDQELTVDIVCGEGLSQRQSNKIVGGRVCQSPNGTVVKILLFDEEDNQTICSGVRLNSTTILTAAHCLNEFVFSVSVELAPGKRVVPLEITLHPEATNLGSIFINDLALLTISPPEGEMPPPTVQIAERIEVGDTLTILGYGATDGASSAGSGVLRIGEMRVNQVTSESIFSDYSPPILSNTCFGDSGGPAFIEDTNGGFALAGITSTGANTMCEVGDRSAFTNLTNQALRRFIQDNS
jgi:hypothetical protein